MTRYNPDSHGSESRNSPTEGRTSLTTDNPSRLVAAHHFGV